MTDITPVPAAPSAELVQLQYAPPAVRQAPADWYPDAASGQMRYWDGNAWTNHYAPKAAPGPQVVVINQARQGPNHVLHLLLTVFTAGLWLPVWIIIAIAN